MLTKLKVVFIIFFIVVSFLIGAYQMAISKDGFNEVNTGFSMEKAINHIKIIAAEPHPVSSEQNAKVRDYIVNQLKDLGLDVEIHKKSMIKKGQAIPVENIFAILKGGGSNAKKIALVAHYDSTPFGPGAADDGAGVAAILEAVRVIKEGSKFKNDILILITDGEEQGILGARAFAEDKPDVVSHLDFVINAEARGNKGPVVMFETSNKNLGIVEVFEKVSPHPIGFSFSQDVYKRMPNDTDFTVFNKLNIKGINLAVLDGFDAYHNELDNVENLSRSSLLHYGHTVTKMAEYMANADADSFSELEIQESAVYFPFFKGNLSIYSSKLVIPFTIMALCCLMAITIMGLKKKILKFKDILKGSLFSLGMIFSVVFLSAIFMKMVLYVHKVQVKGFTVKGFRYSDIYFGMAAALSLVVLIFICRWLSVKNNIIGLIYGGFYISAILLMASSIYFPGLSYMFTWPFLVNILALGYIEIRGLERVRSGEFLGIFAVISFVNIMIFLPVIYMVYIAMTIGMLPVLVFLLVLPIIYMVPFTMVLLKSGNSDKSIAFSA
ncbi:MAG: M20/M25/M40 family metallo-hydrolase [Clostridia bacterium]|nr:M20/M25/M40 family metallo-hydrolase [Clostridia bacterium]